MIRPVTIEDGNTLLVFDDGRIFRGTHELKQREYSKTGYMYVQCCGANYLVHRLVASAFIRHLPRNDRRLHVHHKDGDKKNNSVSNLSVMDSAEHNRLHKEVYPKIKTCIVCGKEFTPAETKRKTAQTCSHSCKLKLLKYKARSRQRPIVQLTIDGAFVKRWSSAREAQTNTGFFESNINKCCHGHIKSYKGYKWKYEMLEDEIYRMIEGNR